MTTATERAYRHMRQMVLNGELVPGQRVSQLKLARAIDCSSTPVAVAMRRLEGEGLLVKEPRKMAKVRKLAREELEDLYLVREGLEMVSARLCAKLISEEQIAELRELGRRYQQVAKAEDLQETKNIDIEIHHFIARCAACPLLEEQLSRLKLIELTAGQPDVWLDPDILINRHRAIIEAICDHDTDSAEYLMRKHIAAARHEMR